MKKMLAMLLALVMLMSMTMAAAHAEEPRLITIATQWEIYYDSFHTSLEDDPAYSGALAAQMKFDAIKAIEEKYNVQFDFVNFTYSGAQESINTSVLAGTPDADIYMIDLKLAAPAAANGYVMDMRDVLSADHPLIKGEDAVLTHVDMGNGKIQMLVANSAESMVGATYPMAFNLQMIEDANLEDPRDLVERGEWTWDKFVEYCQKLTRDTDGDGTIDVYGFGGWPEDFFSNWLMSNGTTVASTPKENLSSPEVAEVLQFMQDLRLKYDVLYPVPDENGWDVCRYLYRDGKVAFTSIAAWIMDSYSDYAYGEPDLPSLDFDMVFIPYPVGPHGNAETNAQKVVDGSTYVIPVGVEDPELVFNVLYDILNWYGYDAADPAAAEEALALRDDPETLDWWYGVTGRDLDIQDHNFEVMMEMGRHQVTDNVANLGFALPLREFVKGDYTTAQLQETYKQQVQDALDRLFGN